MKLSEVIENLQKELEKTGDMEVVSVEPPSTEGEILDLRYA